MNELPPEVLAAFREYVMFRGDVLMFEHELKSLKAGGQCDLVAKGEIRLEHMKKIQQQAREKLNTIISLKRVSSEEIVKALS